MRRLAQIALAGVAVYGTVTAAVYNYCSIAARDRDVKPDSIIAANVDRAAAFQRAAASYDADIGLDETLMGLRLLRRALLWRAAGNVLEVACGTARNLPYYHGAVNTLLCIDRSDLMVAEARAKIASNTQWATRFRAEVADAVDLAAPGCTPFDCVVDTFGLCSFDDPVAVLRAMAHAVGPGGTLLLLEHGRSHFSFINRILDQNAGEHACRWGCVWNRDILELIAAAGLLVEIQHRFHFGTTYFLQCRAPSLATSHDKSE